MSETAESHVCVIAEAGVNHNGDLDMALRLVDAAADAGADMVKFQTFRAERLVTGAARKAAYQVRNTGSDDGQLAMLKRLELDEAAHHRLLAHCRDREILFMSTPFDDDSTDFLLDGLGMDVVKIGSGDMTNGPHLLRIAKRNVDIVLSTGMASLDEVAEALGVLALGATGGLPPSATAFAAALADPAGRAWLARRVTLLHCTSNYPAPIDEINLAVMDLYREVFPCPVGLSDHSAGITVPVAAVGRGARMIEKHLTLDRTLPGPDHVASVEPAEFAAMVTAIREASRAIGVPLKMPTSSERQTLDVARKSLVAARPIAVGTRFTAADLAIKRPGGGLRPNLYWELIGRAAVRAYETDDLIVEPLI